MLKEIGFSQARHVQGRASIADLFPQEKRCGLYVLHFANGEIYAGQALDVTRRYVQHRKVHSDIQQISFRQVDKGRLNDEERTLIWELEQSGYRLRNIVFTSIPKGESDFDLVMPITEQEQWLQDLRVVDPPGERVIEPELRCKYRRNYQRFLQLPHATQTIDVLKAYVRCGIPAVRRGEISFWSCSCLPSYRDPACTVYFRVNVNWQEVFSAYTLKGYPGLFFFSWHLARSPLERVLGKTFVRHYPVVGVHDPLYKPGGQDQINIITQGVGPTLTLLREDNILSAVRLFNLRLMKKGPCNFGRYHCMDLADRLVGAG